MISLTVDPIDDLATHSISTARHERGTVVLTFPVSGEPHELTLTRNSAAHLLKLLQPAVLDATRHLNKP